MTRTLHRPEADGHPLIAALAITTLLLVGAYHALRYAAEQCTGGGCDAYIPLSLVVPIAGWLAAVATGLSAYLVAPPAARPWRGVLAVATVLAFFGPVASLLLLRDSPDLFVLVGTAILTIVALTALTYSVTSAGRP